MGVGAGLLSTKFELIPTFLGLVEPPSLAYVFGRNMTPRYANRCIP